MKRPELSLSWRETLNCFSGKEPEAAGGGSAVSEDVGACKSRSTHPSSSGRHAPNINIAIKIIMETAKSIFSTHLWFHEVMDMFFTEVRNFFTN